MRNYEDLHVWQKAHVLTLAIYKVHAVFSKRREIWADKPDSKVMRFDRS